MSADLGQRLKVFFASAPQNIHRVEVVELAHSALTQTYLLWKETRAGQVTDEFGLVRNVIPAGFAVRPAGTETHLDQVYDITLDTTQSDNLFRTELERIPIDSTERISCVFREYLSDDLLEPQAVAYLQIEETTYKLGAAVLRAVQPRFNITRTGELYVPREVPMIRGFL
jgi:hypothetical protein